jgi:hypothetical protein
MRISKIFGLNKSQFELDFVDIDTSVDTKLFLDPYFIGKCRSPLAISCRATIHSFFQLLVTYLQANDVDSAREQFSYLHEPNETCLGMSSSAPKGRGVGAMDFEKIFESLLQSKAVKTGIAEDLEDFRIFVGNFDKDKLSDMTTNILRKHLLIYTAQQCTLHGIPLQENVATGPYWERKSSSWETKHYRALISNDKRYLLIPKRFVSYSDKYTQQKYTQHFVLNFLQNEHLRLNTALVQVRRDKKGNIKKKFVTKKNIRNKEGRIDKEWLVDFTQKNPQVFQKFKEDTKNSLHVLSNEEMGETKSIEAVCDYLRDELISTPSGPENATKYHRIVTGILHLCFYPSLTCPTIEKEIHEGRKRIDLVFENTADSGFFFRTASRMPAQFVFIECKNYTKDPKNPELDQMAGRFGPSRSQLGLILCRDIDDYGLFLQRCVDTYRDSRGLILPLMDSDLVSFLDATKRSRMDEVEGRLQQLYSSIVVA